MNESLLERIDSAVVDDRENGIFRCRRDVFTDPEFFDLEMTHIFEGNWVFLAHESQIPEPNDYFTTWMGRQPVVITRDKAGELHAFINACAHRGAMLCRRKHGNKGSFTCPFHGWTFSNAGKLLKVKDGKTGNYPAAFDVEGSHDLVRVARFENYRGFLFGSLNPEVSSLEDYLGGTKTVIDQIVDQAPHGLEVLRGNSSYIYDGNWKLQIENGADGYHVSSVHWNYSATMGRRNYEEDGTRTVDANGWSKSLGGVYAFENGHILLWTKLLNPEVRPVYAQRAKLVERLGEERAAPIVEQTRNLGLYPNVYLMDQFSTQIRVVRPISVDKTEITIYCFAVKGESAADRTLRIRQYEDFFNVSGMGTPDDLEEFRACQAAYAEGGKLWNDLSRGATDWINGPDENARALGLTPLLSGERSEDEGLFVRQHEHWAHVLRSALVKGGGGGGQSGVTGTGKLRNVAMNDEYRQVSAFLYQEARLLDDQQWDEWLRCYAPKVEFWMPAWDDDDQLVEDPQSQISLIYYPNREGLEDRVFRIKTERSGASTPEPRTCHFLTNIEILSRSGSSLDLRFNWHTLSHRYRNTDIFFGTSFYTLDLSGETPVITGKKVVLKNDYIHQVVDIYHI